jgi:hypothetical protein
MIAESVLRRHLEEGYGEGWFDRPEAGSFLRGLWAGGEKLESEDLARMVGYEALDTALLADRFLDLRAPDP